MEVPELVVEGVRVEGRVVDREWWLTLTFPSRLQLTTVRFRLSTWMPVTVFVCLPRPLASGLVVSMSG